MNVLALALGALGTNCYLVWSDTSREAALVDCSGDAGALLAAADDRGLQIRLVVVTHGHIDHIDALADLRSRLEVRVAVHALDAALLGDPMLSGAALFGFSQKAVTPDLLLQEGETVSLEGSGVSLKVLHTPGHTLGSICLLGEDTLFSGDLLFAGGIGRTDLPGGNHDTLIRSITERLWPMGDDTVFIPGHGPESTFGRERRSNPYVSGT